MSVRTYPPAIQSVPGLVIPDYHDVTQPAFVVSVLLDASGEKFAVMLQAPKTGSIRKVHWLTVVVTTPTNTDVRIETIDATTGNPSGTLWAANTNGTQASASITTDTELTTTLTADASVTRGDKLAVVFAPTGTPNYNIGAVSLDTVNPWLFPYVKHFVAAAWGDPAGYTALLPIVSLEYSDGTFAYIPGVYPAATLTATLFNNSSTPDERALKFTLPVSVRVAGAWVTVDEDGDYDLVLYDANGTTALATLSNDKDTSGTFLTNTGLYLFSSSVTLLANTAYRLAVKPTSATNIRTGFYTVSAAAVFDQTAGGQNFHWSERTDAGAWTDTTTKRPMMGLIIDGIQG